MAPNNYDLIAGNYDWISKVVFGQNLICSQTCLLPHIPAESKVLIVGGGTGWILEEISKVHHSGLIITYLDISEKMIELAKKRSGFENHIIFVKKPVEEYESTELYDIILTPFLFDNFQEKKAEFVFSKLNNMMNPNGKWLFVDFHIDGQSKFWQKPLLWIMLLFFRIVCNIEARNLIPMKPVFLQNRFEETHEYIHFYGFIKSSVYVKTT